MKANFASVIHFYQMFLWAINVLTEENIAFNKEAKQVSTYENNVAHFGPQLGNDGNLQQNAGNGECAHVNYPEPVSWWTVDLGKVYNITMITIYGRTDCCQDRHSNFNISIYNPKNATWESYDATAGELCYRQIDVAPPILNISCSKQITGRYVKVYTQNVLTLCEVEVFGSVVEYHDLTVLTEENVALNKETKQVSTFENNVTYFGPQLGNDGNLKQDAGNGGCAHVSYPEPVSWWTVDLGKVYNITMITIYGRTDCCQDRHSNFNISIYNPKNATWESYDATAGELCYRQIDVAPPILNISCSKQITGRYVKVYTQNVLTLCEVEVFGSVVEYHDLTVLTEENVALNKETKQVSTFENNVTYFGPQLGNDGNLKQDAGNGGCAHVSYPEPVSWWTVDLGKVYNITMITIYGRTDCCQDRHSNFNISIYNPKNATWESYDATAGELCYRQIDVAPPILNISCSKQITGRYVKVYTQNVLTMCEVEVFGSVVEYHDLTVLTEENVALNKETKQVSTFENNVTYFGPQLGNDGNLKQDAGNGGCAHVSYLEPVSWWTVDLGRVYNITMITIYGRTDCCQDRHSNFDIIIYNPKNATWESYDATAGELCYRQIDVAPQVLNISCSKQITGRYVKVYTQNVLTLCEVEVFGSVVEYHNITEIMCPCDCSYNAKLDYWSSQTVFNHTKEEWLQILAPKLKEQEQELRINRTELSRTRRTKTCAKDNRKSSEGIGMIGAIIISIVIGMFLVIDVLSCQKHIENLKKIRRRY